MVVVEMAVDVVINVVVDTDVVAVVVVSVVVVVVMIVLVVVDDNIGVAVVPWKLGNNDKATLTTIIPIIVITTTAIVERFIFRIIH